jgi:hypothetical protein
LPKALASFGQAKAKHFDRIHAMDLIQNLEGNVIEGEKLSGESLFDEVAKRLHQVKPDGEPNGRLVRYWWENRNEVKTRHLTTTDGKPVYFEDKDKKKGPGERRGTALQNTYG